MLILTRLQAICMTEKDLENPNANDVILSRIMEYLSETRPMHIIKGVSQPDKIKEITNTWNLKIKQHFINKLNAVLKNRPLLPENLETDNGFTYQLRQAAINLDGDFTNDSQFLVLTELKDQFMEQTLTSTLSPALEQNIKEHPESYVILYD